MGDLHGCVTLMEDRLAGVGFDPDRDRLFACGDLVDRGAECHKILAYKDKLWFHSVLGNHEQFAIDYDRGRCNVNLYADVGGKWFMDLPNDERKKFVKFFQQLPIAIEIETDKGLVGIVHAECPGSDWDAFTMDLQSGVSTVLLKEEATTSRERMFNDIGKPVAGLYKMVVGHTPVKQVHHIHNIVYIDTGAVFRGNLTIVNINEL